MVFNPALFMQPIGVDLIRRLSSVEKRERKYLRGGRGLFLERRGFNGGVTKPCS